MRVARSVAVIVVVPVVVPAVASPFDPVLLLIDATAAFEVDQVTDDVRSAGAVEGVAAE